MVFLPNLRTSKFYLAESLDFIAFPRFYLFIHGNNEGNHAFTSDWKYNGQLQRYTSSFPLYIAHNIDLANSAGSLAFRFSSSSLPNDLPEALTEFWLISVLTYRGYTFVIFILWECNSARSDSKSPAIANLEAEYAARIGVPTYPDILLMFTILPSFRLIIWDKTAFVVTMAPKKLVSSTFRSTSRLSRFSSTRHLWLIPALFTRTSILYLATTSFAFLRPSAPFYRSRGAIMALLMQRFLTSISFSSFRAVRITVAPAAENAKASYSPIPDEAPVTHTVLSKNLGIVNQLRLYFRYRIMPTDKSQ